MNRSAFFLLHNGLDEWIILWESVAAAAEKQRVDFSKLRWIAGIREIRLLYSLDGPKLRGLQAMKASGLNYSSHPDPEESFQHAPILWLKCLVKHRMYRPITKRMRETTNNKDERLQNLEYMEQTWDPWGSLAVKRINCHQDFSCDISARCKQARHYKHESISRTTSPTCWAQYLMLGTL